MNANNKRLIWIDIIKIFAAFLIVMQHSLASEWTARMASADDPWKVICFFFILSHVGVPLFFMCSGMTMFQRKHSIKEIYTSNIPRILKPYFFWMLLYGIIEAAGASSLRTAINSVIKAIVFGRYHTWFIAAMIGLYIVTPLIQEFVYDNKLLRYFILISLTFTVLLPYLDLIKDERLTTVINDFHMHFVVGYTLYYLIGYYMGHIRSDRLKTICSCTLIAFVLIISMYLSIKNVGTVGQGIQNYYSSFSILCVVFSVSLYYFIKNCIEDHDSDKAVRFVAKWASLGIGIYLLHPMLLPLIENIHGYYRIFGVLIVYLCALLINWLISLTPLKKLFLG